MRVPSILVPYVEKEEDDDGDDDMGPIFLTELLPGTVPFVVDDTLDPRSSTLHQKLPILLPCRQCRMH